MSTLARTMVRESTRFLRDVYLPRLERALDRLPAGDLWWPPGDDVISVGTILLHLEGNVRQWILGGLCGEPDHRDRDAEFAATDGPGAEELFGALSLTVLGASERIDALSEKQLAACYDIQERLVTGIHAVYHVVEHFGYHTGQAVWIAKFRAAEGRRDVSSASEEVRR
jgi:uncharacterized damage-inducible protein DinB